MRQELTSICLWTIKFLIRNLLRSKKVLRLQRSASSSDAYNKIYNTKYSPNKVIKLLEFKIEETIKKLNKNIDTLCKKYKNSDVNENLSYIYFENEIEWF